MANRAARPLHTFIRSTPPELINLLGSALAIFLVVATGSALAAVLPAGQSPWMFAAAYLAPASLAFIIYWLIAQRL